MNTAELNDHHERRHLELLAATLGAGCIAEHPTSSDKTIALFAVSAARAIQAEVRRTEGGRDDE